MNNKQDHNFIGIYKKAISDDVCDNYINIMDDFIRDNHVGVFKRDEHGTKDIAINCDRYGRLHNYNQIVYDTLHHYMKHYSTTYEILYLESQLKLGFNMQKSSKGGGFYGWHTEQNMGEEGSPRYAAWMIYLNDVVDGGSTEFKFYDLSIQPTKGTLLIWPAGYTHTHRAAPDLNQDKYIITGWFSYE